MQISIRYGPLLAALAAASGVGAAGLAAFENRLKHLKRNGYPPGAKLGKTGRYDYTAGDIVGLAVAVRLMDAYAMPTTAIQLVEAGSKQLSMLALDRLIEIAAPPDAPDGGTEGAGTAPGGDVDEGEAPANPFAASRYAFFPGVALSSLGSRGPGAGRYDAPVEGAVLMNAWEPAPPTASGIMLDGAATFDRLIGELAGRGIDPSALAASLLVELSPAEAAEAERHAGPVHLDGKHRRAFWHLGTMLRLLDGWRPDAALEDRTRLIGHHARLLLDQVGGSDVVAMTIEERSGSTMMETVIAILEESELPIRRLPTGWPASRHIDLLGKIGAPRDQPGFARRWLIDQIPRLATTFQPRNQ